MWDGVFEPYDMRKHHMRARVRERVRVRRNPITEEEYDEPQPYYKVDVRWPPHDEIYVYLIEEKLITREMIERGWLKESEVTPILEAVKEYTKNPLPVARAITDYIEDTFDDL